MRDYLPGGRADKKKTGFIRSQLREGTKHEMEHTNNPAIAKEVAQDHLAEDPHYYTKLNKMEKKMEKKASQFSVGLAKIAAKMPLKNLKKNFGNPGSKILKDISSQVNPSKAELAHYDNVTNFLDDAMKQLRRMHAKKKASK